MPLLRTIGRVAAVATAPARRGAVVLLDRRWPPSPVPDPDARWLDAVLQSLRDIPLESWRRHQGELVRTDVIDGDRWELRFDRPAFADWNWCTTAPSFDGTLVIVGPGKPDRRWKAELETGAEPGAQLWLHDGGWRATSSLWCIDAERGTVRGERGRDQVTPAVGAPSVGLGDWTGLPLASEPPVLPARPGSDVIGMALFATEDMPPSPTKELLYPVRRGGEIYDHRLRVTSRTPLEDESPVDFADGTWNPAAYGGHEGIVEAFELTDERLRVAGRGWELVLTGQELEARLERLPHPF